MELFVSRHHGQHSKRCTEFKYFSILLPKVWGDVRLFSEDQLLKINEFAKGFTGDELKQMWFDSGEVIESFGNVTGYSQDQVAKMWEKIKTTKSIGTFTGGDLKSLGTIALGITAAEIAQINTVAYQ